VSAVPARSPFAGQCTRVYTRRGRSAHLMAPTGTMRPQGIVLCPVRPRWPDEWLGTGNQDEHDRAAALPLCVPCMWRARAEDDYRTEPSQFSPVVSP